MKRPGLLIAALIVLSAATSLRFGTSFEASWVEWFAAISRGPSGEGALSDIVWEIRGPRVASALLGGGLLGAAGGAFQGLFRNPLAEPYVLGVSSGAGAAGAAAMAAGVGAWAGGLGTMIAGLAGGLASLGVVVTLARREGRSEPTILLLAGVAVGALLSALTSVIILGAGGDTNRLMAWLLGSTTPAFWPRVLVLAVLLASGLLLLRREAGRLTALALAGPDAAALGVDIRATFRRTLLFGTAMTAGAVGALGIIGFVGLVAPHLARRIGGVDWRRSLPLSAGLGAAILAFADLVSGRITTLVPALTTELPVGIVTALFGAPWLLYALRRSVA